MLRVFVFQPKAALAKLALVASSSLRLRGGGDRPLSPQTGAFQTWSPDREGGEHPEAGGNSARRVENVIRGMVLVCALGGHAGHGQGIT